MTLSPLAPARHKQGDFFIADIFDNLPLKDDLASMEHPLFTLSMKPDMRILRYENGGVSVEMQPSAFGLPNIMDKDVLLYCASIIMAKINEGEVPPQTIRLSLRDVLITTNRHTGTVGYKYIKTALNRLTGCLLKTTIKTGKTTQGKMFHLLESAEYLESTRVKGRIIGVEVTLSDWFYNSLLAKEVLTINKEYFRLRKPLERRIYEIARKHCGYKRDPWYISLEKLHEKSGSSARLCHFRNTIKNMPDSDHLPDYALNFDEKKDMVGFLYRANPEGLSRARAYNLLTDSEPRTSELPRHIPPALLNEVQSIVSTRLDYYDLWNQYRNWSGSVDARDLYGSFIGFCRKKAVTLLKQG